MSDELVFYTNPMSRGRMVRWMLEEIGQPYRTEIVDMKAKSAGLLAINPMGKVPAITHRGVVVTETAAICAYLADAFPDADLAPPPGDPARGPYYRWLFFAAGPIEAGFTDKSLGVDVPREKQGMVGYGNYSKLLDGLEQAVSSGGYLAGGRFSAADVYVGSQIGFGLQFGSLEKRPAFERYYARLADRPALERANEIDDRLIAAAQG